MTLETRNYVATASDVAAMGRSLLKASEAGQLARANYLRALVGTSQARLADAEEVTERLVLRAVREVHKLFYEALQEVLHADIKDHPRLDKTERKRRAKERQRRTNFARSAKSTLTSWIKAGHDLLKQDPAKVTKTALRDALPKRRHAKPVPAVALRAAARHTKGLITQIKYLERTDPEAAKIAAEETVQQLIKLLAEGARATRDPVEAQSERKLLRAGSGTFWRVEPGKGAPATH
jgi:hypothetical protein